ncbi:hypothetical protein ABPG74_014123 [Tetrahymena malaccensis]
MTNQKEKKVINNSTNSKQEASTELAKKTVDVSTQTELIERDYIPIKQLALMQTESLAFPQILYHQHTVLQLIMFLIMLFVAAFYYTKPQGEDSLLPNAKMGIIFAMISIVIYCMIYLPNTIIQRPHPSLWRMLQALGMCWLTVVVFSLFFNRDDIQTFLKSFVDPALGQPLQDKNFSEDCDIYTPGNPKGDFYNLTDKLDVFFVAHFIGWLVKMFICRDFKLCMIQSILFEFLEITFRHWLPNFYECWWDSIIFDIILCNSGGIITGWWLMQKFNMKEYKWSLSETGQKKKSYWKNVKELFITPNLEKHEWKVFSSSFRFASVVYYMIFMNLVDLSFFFNKFVLWIRPSHPVLSFRTFMIGFLAIPATREYYEYISNPQQKRLGGVCWLTQAIIYSELLVFLKNYNGQFIEAFPDYIIQIWIVIIGVIIAIFIALLIKDVKSWYKNKKEEDSKQKLHDE